MNLGDIRRRVQSNSGDQAGVVVENTDVADSANDAQMKIVKATDILQTTASVNSIAGQENYALPADFIKMVRAHYNGTKLKEVDPYTLDLVYATRDSDDIRGNSLYWYIEGSELILFPKPDVAGVGYVKYKYVKAPTLLVADVDVPEIPTFMHDLIVDYCRMDAKRQTEDFDQAAPYEAWFSQWLAEAKSLANNRSTESYPVVREQLAWDYGIY